jgi:hypothetical protein
MDLSSSAAQDQAPKDADKAQTMSLDSQAVLISGE